MPEITQVEALKRAKKIFDALKHSDNYPEDTWKSIGVNWDLNLFLGKNNNPQATLFRVNSDGDTDVSSGVPVA